ncbi:MAG: hypothetical protein PHU23_15745 [Dehalococcoidales bacterium]|nr:hypothetical protein [Dehalococcoidales bacterium]
MSDPCPDNGDHLRVILFVSTIGGSVSPLVAGYIFDISGGYQIVFLITIAVGIVGLVMAWLLKPKAITC